MILYYLTYKLYILKHYHTDSESNQHLHINCDGNGGGDSGEDSGEDGDSGEEGGGHCEDLNESCSYWAGVGECHRNPAYMHEHCRKSCDLCEDEEEGKNCVFFGICLLNA